MRKYLLFIIAFTSLLPSVHARAAAQTTAKQRVNLTELNDDELLQYGQRLMEKENSDSALLCFELINKHIPADKKLYAQSLHSTGLAYYSRNSYAKAMESYMECLQVCEKNNLTDLLPHIYKDIGNIYSMFNDYQQSSSLYAKALNLARKEGDRMFVNKLLSNLICAYTPQTSIKQYWEYYNEMSRYKENRLRYHYDLLFDKGMILSYEKKNAEAINYFRKSAEFAIANKMPPISLASSYSSLADVYQAMGARDSALLYLMKNKEIARKNNQPTLMIITLRNLSEIYRNINESQSLQYKSEYLALSDSIFNLNEFNGIRNALFYYEMVNKLKTISSLSETNRAKIHEIAMQRRWLITLTVFCIVVVLLVILAYIQNRRLSRSYRYLFHKSQEELAMDKIYARRIKQMQKQVEMLQKNEQQSSVMETPAPETETSAPETIDPEEPKELETDADEGTSDSSRSQIKLSAAQKNALLDSILQVMEHTEEFCDSNFGIERLSSLVNSNSKYVSQVINEVYAKNFRSFLNEFRVKKAMMRMNDNENYGQYTIKAIAESVGYKSQSNFINVFTRQTGIKPSVFQKISREKTSMDIDEKETE